MTCQTAARWTVGTRDKEFENRCARDLGMHPLTAAILRNRGLADVNAIRDFLHPSLNQLGDPFGLPDMQPAVDRIIRALAANEPILVHGDYDVDGITATALLCRYLERLGGNVTYFIPHRINDSYGLSTHTITQAAANGIGLVIAVDCGVTAHEAVAAANAAGLDVIVVDHHEPAATLPEALAVIDPKRADNSYPFREFASVGLAFKLASAVCAAKGIEQRFIQRAYLDLVALGTIADVVPLVGENRAMTAEGLRLLNNTKKTGLRALMNICGVNGSLCASDVGFRLGPRLNAAGRMADATAALELLLTHDEAEGLRLAKYLDDVNRERQATQNEAFKEALERVEEDIDLDRERVIVTAGDWHQGVLGIVASKLLDRYSRPTVVLATNGDIVQGSARSIAGFDINAAFTECSDLLQRCGGHAFAAGLALYTANLPAFRERINQVAAERMSDEDMIPQLDIDAEILLPEIDLELMNGLAQLEPCGHSNPPPLFCSAGVEVLEAWTVGRDSQHLKLCVAQEGQTMDCIGFGLASGAEWVSPQSRVDICYTVEINEYNGLQGLQLCLEGIRPTHREA